MTLSDAHSTDLQSRIYDIYRELRDHHPAYFNERRYEDAANTYTRPRDERLIDIDP